MCKPLKECLSESANPLLLPIHPIRVTKTGCSIWTSPIFALNTKELILPSFSSLISPCMPGRNDLIDKHPMRRTGTTPTNKQQLSLWPKSKAYHLEIMISLTRDFPRLLDLLSYTKPLTFASVPFSRNVKALSIRWRQVLSHCPLFPGMATGLL